MDWARKDNNQIPDRSWANQISPPRNLTLKCDAVLSPERKGQNECMVLSTVRLLDQPVGVLSALPIFYIFPLCLGNFEIIGFFFFFLQQKITWTKTVAEVGLKPVSWLPDLCSFSHTEWQRRCFPRSSQNSGFWVCHTKPYHPKAFSRFREGVSGMCLVPWSLEQLPWGCVWRFPEQQERMVIKSSGTEARLSEFKSILVSTH